MLDVTKHLVVNIMCHKVLNQFLACNLCVCVCIVYNAIHSCIIYEWVSFYSKHLIICKMFKWLLLKRYNYRKKNYKYQQQCEIRIVNVRYNGRNECNIV